MNQEDFTGSAEDERVIALNPVQLGALGALLVAIMLIFRSVRRDN